MASGDAAVRTPVSGGRAVVMAVVFLVILTGCGLLALLLYFPAAAVFGIATLVMALWARRRFPDHRAVFVALAIAGAMTALVSVALDLLLLAAGDGAPTTRVTPL